ncbi:integrase catalytic domain-containing protein [Trichonephila inaurata madagascariensis]|uniref:Integrase catalytic domain-containing protein n=1 Tax=Trichonephila inaurata madagascariensis TaxID=2747483 RepID=A0A8X6WWK6_9ARAC|nr:integrase catalytic domain-containing protein [Trichonephila inaurata madagascariensis]
MDATNQAILERAKKTRSVSRPIVTKQINKLESEISNLADKTTVHEIYMQLISKFEELSTLDKEIENLIDTESLEEEILTREEYRDKFIIWKIRAERYVGSVSNIAIQNSVENQPQNITLPLNRTEILEDRKFRNLDKDSVTLGNGDEEILSEFDKLVSFVDGRYRVNLPWKPGMREAFTNNKTVARKRFEGLVRRFKCDHELFCEYKDVIDDYVREGIVERTSCDSLSDSQGFYLPHHAVIRSDKTTSRIRIVFDGSAHEDGQSSLNQSLYTGPNLHPNILELLLCFRKSPVAFTADVKSAFLQIELDLRDRDFTRFFWTDNLNNEPYVLNFTRVLFGLRPSPYLLAATLKHHFKKYKEQYSHTFELLNSFIYVDDLIWSE